MPQAGTPRLRGWSPMTDGDDRVPIEVTLDEETNRHVEALAESLDVHPDVVATAYASWSLDALEEAVEEGDEERVAEIFGDLADDPDLDALAEVFDRV